MEKMRILIISSFILILTVSLAFSQNFTRKNLEKIDLVKVLENGGFEVENVRFVPNVYENYLRLNSFDKEGKKFVNYIFKIQPFYSFEKEIVFKDSTGKTRNFLISANEKELKEFLEGEKNYIVEFTDKPVLAKTIELEEVEIKKGFGIFSIQRKILSKEIQEYAKNLKEKHEMAKKEIFQILGDSNIKEKKSKEFFYTFNGISIKANEKVIKKIKSLPYVKKVYEDRKVHAFLNESVPLINATNLWKILDSQGRNITGKDIKIAIVDTGVDYTHEDLGGCFGPNCKVIDGWDYVNDDSNPMDDHGHGTHVAAIAAGNGTLKGVAPDAKILAYKVLDKFGSGYESDIIAGIEQAITKGAQVISLSLGLSYSWFENCYDVAISSTVDNAVESGVVVVVAAGNEGPEYQTIAAPACAKKVIAVGATTKTDKIASFSSRGPHISKNETIPKPEVVAPGEDICSAQWDNAYSSYKCDETHISMSGTSMATPHVSGLAALLLQAHPDWKPEDVKSAIMLGSVDLGYDVATQGTGRIDATKAYNTPILTYPQSIGIKLQNTNVANTTIRIKNIKNSEVTINFFLPNATDFEGKSYNITSLNTTQLSIPQNSEKAVLFSVNLSETGGVIFGKIILNINSINYTIPYTLVKLIEVNVSVVGFNATLYPDICIHDDEGGNTFCKSQGWDFVGNNFTFLVSPLRNYTVYAYGDWENTSLEYILMNRSSVSDASSEIILNLSEARPFIVRGKSLDNKNLKLYEWEKGFISYLNATKMLLSVSVEDDSGVVGDRIVYISNKPEGPVNTDVILRYTGVPLK